jgi:hypothetical protein
MNKVDGEILFNQCCNWSIFNLSNAFNCVMPVQAGIQRLLIERRTLDYRIHPCITNYVL